MKSRIKKKGYLFPEKKVHRHFFALIHLSILPLCCLLFFSISAKAQPQLTFSPLVSGLTSPLEVTNAADGSGRLFIVEERGVIKIYKNGSLLSKPFLDISANISTKNNRGLWSIAFDPKYKKNRTFYLYFTDSSNALNLTRYQTSKTNPDSAIVSSGVTLIKKIAGINDAAGRFGELHFGPDGYLYVSMSDGSSSTRTSNNSQDGSDLSGKMLRLNVSNVTAPPYYTIPLDNPFVNDPNVRDEIWAMGLKQPWRWSFDRLTGNMWIGEVGGKKWEEINFSTPALSAGANYGWPCYEANGVLDSSCSGISYTPSIFSYPHDSSFGGECILGGYVYRGKKYPAMKGYYICADKETGNAWKVKQTPVGWNVYLQAGAPLEIVGFGEGEDGELYAASFNNTVYQVQATASVAAAGTNEATAVTAARNLPIKSYVYPTMVENSTVTLELKEAYKLARVIDMSGHEITHKTLDGITGRVTLNLPKLDAGMYIVQLIGIHNLQQKIYVSK